MKTTVEIDLSPRDIAELFCAWTDEEQTQFFHDVADVMAKWAPSARDSQIEFIGRHISDCACGGEGARAFVADLHASMTEQG